jgi:hypothetical protein
MILTNSVLVKSSKYYYKLGYNIDSKYIKIDISHLPKGSHVPILAKCDYCDNDKEISYKDYNKNISKNKKFSCSIKCGVSKSKENNLLKYGVESVNQLDSKKIKTKETIIERYGTDHVSKIESVRKSKSYKMTLQKDKISKNISEYWSNLSADKIDIINNKREITNLERWGFKYISQVESIKEKSKKTNLERWGGYTYQSDILMKKVISTNLERWGVTYSSSSPIIKEKRINTNLKRWGYDYASRSPIVKQKAKSTNLESWGVENIMFLPEVVKILNNKFYNKYGTDSYFKTDIFKDSFVYNPMGNDYFRNNLIISNNKYYIKYIDKSISEFNCDCNKDHTFLISSINFHNRVKLDSKLCTVCYPIGDQKSIKQLEFTNFIKSIYKGDIISGYRDGLEIDIYLPHLNLGFEFNGLYWHSELYKDKSYHLDKTNHFKEKGIRIIHIWEDDWDLKKDIVKSQIRNWLGITENKIFARNCQVGIVSKSEYISFIENNHIQGYTSTSIKLGLYFKGDLVSIMTFDCLEGRRKMKEGGWNLSRFCSKLNTNVIGATSKLLTYFIKNYQPNRIISYADMDWSLGELYKKLGFKLDKTIKPDYKYIFEGKRINKQRFTKKRLKSMGFDIEKTESEITKEIGIYRIYNVGQLKFEINF